MSFICRVVIGYFDPKAACEERSVSPTRPLTPKHLRYLQALCERLFGGEWRLEEHFTSEGMLCFQSGSIGRKIYQLVGVAREVFGMSAVDVAHGCEVVLGDESSIPPRQTWSGYYREQHSEWDEQRIEKETTSSHERACAQARLEREVLEQVRAFLHQRG